MDEKRTEELNDEALDAVSGGARTLIANTDTPSRPGGRPADQAEETNPLKPRKIY